VHQALFVPLFDEARPVVRTVGANGSALLAYTGAEGLVAGGWGDTPWVAIPGADLLRLAARERLAGIAIDDDVLLRTA
jgi:hypothetical protein